MPITAVYLNKYASVYQEVYFIMFDRMLPFVRNIFLIHPFCYCVLDSAYGGSGFGNPFLRAFVNTIPVVITFLIAKLVLVVLGVTFFSSQFFSAIRALYIYIVRAYDSFISYTRQLFLAFLRANNLISTRKITEHFPAYRTLLGYLLTTLFGISLSGRFYRADFRACSSSPMIWHSFKSRGTHRAYSLYRSLLVLFPCVVCIMAEYRTELFSFLRRWLIIDFLLTMQAVFSFLTIQISGAFLRTVFLILCWGCIVFSFASLTRFIHLATLNENPEYSRRSRQNEHTGLSDMITYLFDYLPRLMVIIPQGKG